MPEAKVNRGGFIRTVTGAGCLFALCPLAGAAGVGDKPFRLLEVPRHKRDFQDGRSGKVIFLAHCIVNQNSKMHQTASVPSCIKPIIGLCMDHEVGMVQMPCPELMVVGLGRDRDEPEQEYLRQALEMPLSRERTRELAEQVVYQMNEYRFQGFEMLGVVGANGSPSCGVETTAFPDPRNRFGPGEGVFIQELRGAMKKAGLDLAFKGLDTDKVEETLAWIQKRLQKPG